MEYESGILSRFSDCVNNNISWTLKIALTCTSYGAYMKNTNHKHEILVVNEIISAVLIVVFLDITIKT